MEGIRIDVSESITPEHLMSIEEGLNEFNGYMTGISDCKPLSVVIRGISSGKILGGMLDRSSLALLFIVRAALEYPPQQGKTLINTV